SGVGRAGESTAVAIMPGPRPRTHRSIGRRLVRTTVWTALRSANRLAPLSLFYHTARPTSLRTPRTDRGRGRRSNVTATVGPTPTAGWRRDTRRVAWQSASTDDRAFSRRAQS